MCLARPVAFSRRIARSSSNRGSAASNKRDVGRERVRARFQSPRQQSPLVRTKRSLTRELLESTNTLTHIEDTQRQKQAAVTAKAVAQFPRARCASRHGVPERLASRTAPMKRARRKACRLGAYRFLAFSQSSSTSQSSKNHRKTEKKQDGDSRLERKATAYRDSMGVTRLWRVFVSRMQPSVRQCPIHFLDSLRALSPFLLPVPNSLLSSANARDLCMYT